MLRNIFGTKTTELALLHLFHYGEIHPSGLAKDINISLSSVQNQLAKLEEAGVLASKLVGKTRVYSFNKKSPLTQPLMELVKVVHDSLSLEDKKRVFKSRKRPRRPGKPILSKLGESE